MPAKPTPVPDLSTATVSRAGASAVVTGAKGLKDLIDRAQAGDASAVPALRQLFANPAAVDVLGGDLARDARDKLIENYAGKNRMVREALARKAELLQAEVAGPDPSPLERLLADRVVSCWLFLHHLEALYALKESMTLTLGDYYLRNIHRAQKSYLAAVKALALVRRLAVPTLRVTVAREQGSPPAPAADEPARTPPRPAGAPDPPPGPDRPRPLVSGRTAGPDRDRTPAALPWPANGKTLRPQRRRALAK